jgi:hypothetical protein
MKGDTVYRILVIANETADSEQLHDVVRTAANGLQAQVLVVAPALNSRIRHWLSDSDEAREEARRRFVRCVGGLAGVGVGANGMIGDSDPLHATVDALHLFPADEIVIATPRNTVPTGSRGTSSSAWRSGSTDRSCTSSSTPSGSCWPPRFAGARWSAEVAAGGTLTHRGRWSHALRRVWPRLRRARSARWSPRPRRSRAPTAAPRRHAIWTAALPAASRSASCVRSAGRTRRSTRTTARFAAPHSLRRRSPSKREAGRPAWSEDGPLPPEARAVGESASPRFHPRWRARRGAGRPPWRAGRTGGSAGT